MSKREGDCLKCGKCCRWVHTETAPEEKIDWKLVDARGLMVAKRRSNNLSVFAMSICRKLGGDNTCLVQGEKPQVCKDFPANPNHILPGCGFRFK
jgi:hypothetical protein